ncbi:MAG: copper homeostasis protein CutC [Planctomycetota bacterium]
MVLEIAVDRLEDARAAEGAGAQRLEFCAALALDGLTPTLAALDAVLDAVRIPVAVLVRPRPGDFVHEPPEADLYVAEVRAVATRSVEAIVVGALDREGGLDLPLLGRLVDAAAGKTLVFHRAFDRLRDRPDGARALAALGFARILSSGGAPDAAAGREGLRELLALPDAPRVVAAGGVRAAGAAALLALGDLDLHSSARREVLARDEGVGSGEPRRLSVDEVSALRANLPAS